MEEVIPEIVSEIAVEAPVVEPTLLGEAPVVELAEPAVEPVVAPEIEPIITTVAEPEVQPAVEEQQSSQSDEPAPLPTYDEFKVEGFDLDPDQIGDLTKTLSEFEIKTKADHAEIQALGQFLVERHVAEVKKSIDLLNKSYLDAFETQKNEWKESFLKDPEIGGNRWETTTNAAREFITTHGGTVEQQTEIRQLMETSGLGNHPAMIRIFAKAMSNMSEGKPIPATTPVPTVKNKIDKRYGAS